jgi:hypothetical protein
MTKTRRSFDVSLWPAGLARDLADSRVDLEAFYDAMTPFVDNARWLGQSFVAFEKGGCRGTLSRRGYGELRCLASNSPDFVLCARALLDAARAAHLEFAQMNGYLHWPAGNKDTLPVIRTLEHLSRCNGMVMQALLDEQNHTIAVARRPIRSE